jgi:electron transfer flavoprotein beta subunit
LLRVVVCIKQVSYVYHPLAMDETGTQLDPEKMVSMLNPYDEIALEQAITIKEYVDDCEIVAICAGLARSEEALRYAFAMGADRIIRIDFESIDPWLTSLVLARVIKNLEYDIVLCGKKAIDTNAGQVGSFLGELLQLPQVSGIVGLKLFPEERKAIADRYLGRGDRQVVECALPALFTVEDGLNDPRYPTLGRRLLAKKEDVEVIKVDLRELLTDRDVDLSSFMSFSPPRPKPKKIFTPDSNISATERMRLIMTGGITEKKSDLLEGKAEDISKKIIDLLVREKIV